MEGTQLIPGTISCYTYPSARIALHKTNRAGVIKLTSSNCRGAGERPENRGTSHAQTEDQADGASGSDSQNSNPKGVIYCRVVAIAVSVTQKNLNLSFGY